MEIEYGVKTENKFALADLADDEVLDPSELLSRLETNFKDVKSSLLTAKKKPAIQQKKPTFGAENAARTTTTNKADPTRQLRITTNKENVSLNDSNKEAGPRRFPRGAANIRGAPRNRPPRQERSDVPPRFRQPNENGQGFPQNGFNDNRESFAPSGQMDVQQNGFGVGFGGGFGNQDEGVNAEGRQFNRRAFGGRGGAFGGRGFDGGGGRRRPYDRQSGSDKTGVKAVDKRDGAGAHNWGSAADVIADDAGAVERPDAATFGDSAVAADVAVDENGDKNAEYNEREKTADNAQNESAEPEPVLLTLDEWKAQQGQRQRPQFNVRRPGEGDKNPAWDKLKPLKAGDDPKKGKNKSKSREVMPPTEEDEDDEEVEDNKVVPIDIRFIGGPMRRGGGRGRGAPSGGRGFGGGPRANEGTGFGRQNFTQKKEELGPSETPYKIDDESFPTLS